MYWLIAVILGGWFPLLLCIRYTGVCHWMGSQVLSSRCEIEFNLNEYLAAYLNQVFSCTSTCRLNSWSFQTEMIWGFKFNSWFRRGISTLICLGGGDGIVVTRPNVCLFQVTPPVLDWRLDLCVNRQGSYRSWETWKVIEFKNKLYLRPGNSWNLVFGPGKSLKLKGLCNR